MVVSGVVVLLRVDEVSHHLTLVAVVAELLEDLLKGLGFLLLDEYITLLRGEVPQLWLTILEDDRVGYANLLEALLE